MNKKNSSSELRKEAQQMVEASRRLDYQGILAHHPEAIARLKQVAAELRLDLGRLRPASGEALAEYAHIPPQPKGRPITPQLSVQERRKACVEALTKAGLGGRLGKLYSSSAVQRLVPFKEAPHRRGLIPFDMVVAADYTPGEGYHAIFITATEVLAGFLALPSETRDWQLRARAGHANMAQMVEKVGLMSAGFPVS